MTCADCGEPCQGRRCRDCTRWRRRQGGRGARSEVEEMQCTSCGNQYLTDGSDACPLCGSRRRRYAGDLP